MMLPTQVDMTRAPSTQWAVPSTCTLVLFQFAAGVWPLFRVLFILWKGDRSA